MTYATMAENINSNMSSGRSSRVKFGQLLHWSDHPSEEEDNNNGNNNNGSSSSSNSSPRVSFYNDEISSPSPYNTNNNNYPMSPWSQTSPYIKSPWIKFSPLIPNPNKNNNYHYPHFSKNCLIGSLLREEGHVYSLAVKVGMLYTGSESKNIRVWRDFHDAGGFKSGSGLVKAIVISKDNRVFTGHQDGKIRIWSSNGKRVGTLPKLGDYLLSSLNPKSYVEVRRHHKVPRIKHFDAVSCLSLNNESGLLYSGSWDKTIKVWRISDGKCLESMDDAHDDAINSIVVGFDGLVFSGSADGSLKVWRRELHGKSTRHFHIRTLLNQENAVTSLAVSIEENGGSVLYCGSSDGLVNFWEKEKEDLELFYGGVLRGHKLAVLCLATGGCLVFSGSADKSICVWKRDVGGVRTCLAVLAGHSGPVKCLAVEEDVDDDHDEDQRQWIVYSGSLDKSVKIWRVSIGARAL